MTSSETADFHYGPWQRCAGHTDNGDHAHAYREIRGPHWHLDINDDEHDGITVGLQGQEHADADVDMLITISEPIVLAPDDADDLAELLHHAAMIARGFHEHHNKMTAHNN